MVDQFEDLQRAAEAQEFTAALLAEPVSVTRQPPRIYAAMVQAMKAVTHVGKDGYNQQQNYPFRGIDGVINALGPAMRTAGIFMTAELLDIRYRDARTTLDKPTREVLVQVRYTFTAEDGSSVSTVAPGESLDTGDKGTAKAMSVALRVALLQAFALPTQEPTTDHDGHYHQRGGEPRMSKFERDAGLALLRVPLEGERAAAGAEMMRAALQQALDFRACIEEHAAWLAPSNGDESPTWEELFYARVAAEIETVDTGEQGKALWATLKAAELLTMARDGVRFGQLLNDRAAAIKTRNAQALDTITEQVLQANLDDLEPVNGSPVFASIEAAYNLGRITSAEQGELFKLAEERKQRLAAEAATLQNEPAGVEG